MPVILLTPVFVHGGRVAAIVVGREYMKEKMMERVSMNECIRCRLKVGIDLDGLCVCGLFF